MLASWDTSRDIVTYGWEREIMSRAGDLEGRMVSGEMAFLATHLFALESRRQINCLSEQLDRAENTVSEMWVIGGTGGRGLYFETEGGGFGET